MKVLSSLLIALTLMLPLPGLAGAEPAAGLSESQKVTHVLNRLTFGARPGDAERVRRLGVQRFIQSQLDPNGMAESPIVTSQLQKSAAIRDAPSSKLLAEYQMQRKEFRQTKAKGASPQSAFLPPPGDGQQDGSMTEKPAPYIQEFGRRRPKPQGSDARLRQLVESGVIETKLVRAIESPRQLNELMADFWFNHFNICITKGADHVLIGAYEEQAIRPNVLGNFRDLLGATMHHPAMMFYLDNAQNTKAGFRTNSPNNPKSGINENYARELLELHTLGVDGGYTQKDVMELARVLTGWGLPGKRNVESDGGYWATFDERRHDFGDKVVLGQTIKGTGRQEIEQVLDFLARHPATANHLSYQLAQYFVDDNPPASLVSRLSASYQKSHGNIKTVLSTMFASPEFWDQRYENAKFKSPFRYAVSAFRATGMPVTRTRQVAAFLKLQGQPLYACLTPDGYKNTKEAWLNPDGLIKRMEFAEKLAAVANRSQSVDYRSVLTAVNGGRLSPKTAKALGGADPSQRLAALMGSPEFMRY